MSAQIRLEGLSKQYRINHLNQGSTLRESIAGVLKRPFRRSNESQETIWALRDVSFSIQNGETVGIIGRNGAGKSTLLKILSKITYPTSGSVTVEGRVAALLEVGTGFHPELTGRENIYMNGSILGMRKKEVDQKMESIIEFSGVEKFLDTPIKRYSSGMRLRLGFAVAAHLDPDILIVDEVLAVGDAAFQKKCLETMDHIRRRQRTVLFVSHNLAAVENLCRRCIWIEAGVVRMDGPARAVVEAYMGSVAEPQPSAEDLGPVRNRRGNGKIQFTGLEFLSLDGTSQKVIRSGAPLIIRFSYAARESVAAPSFGFRMYTEMGTLVTESSTWHHGIHVPIAAGEGYLDLEIDCLNLMTARYLLSLWITDSDGITVYDNIEHAVTLEIEPANIYLSGRELDSRCGIVFFPQKWNLSGVFGRDEELAGSANQSDSLAR